MAESPENRAQSLLERGATLYEGGKLYEALSCWKQVLQIDPENEIAAEYLRFIEDNFQIGVDAFIEHHESPVSAPVGVETSGPPPAVAPPAGIATTPGESIEELDWSEILEDKVDAVVRPPPVPEAPMPEPDLEDFFSELDPSSLRADPGGEAEAWGARDGQTPSGNNDRMASSELAPDQDPMSMGSASFTSGYTPPPLAVEHGSVSAEILPGDPGSRRRASGRLSDGPSLVQVPSPTSEPDAGLDNLDMMLDRDFQAWDDHEGSGVLDDLAGGSADDEARELHDLISAGLEAPIATIPPQSSAPPPIVDRGRANGATSRPATPVEPVEEVFNADYVVAEQAARATEPTPSSEAAGKVMRRSKRKPDSDSSRPGKVDRDRAPTPVRGFPAVDLSSPPSPGDELENLLKAGLADLDAIERGEMPAAPAVNRLSKPAPDTDLNALMADARRKLQADDFTGALELVEQVLAGDPNHEEARRYLEENTTRLLQMYRSRLGKLSRIPRVKLRPSEIIWQSLDHRAGFLLSQVDGRTSFEDIIDISGMSELEASRILARLVEHGVIG